MLVIGVSHCASFVRSGACRGIRLLPWGWYVLPAPFEWVEEVASLVCELAFPHEGVVFEVLNVGMFPLVPFFFFPLG